MFHNIIISESKEILEIKNDIRTLAKLYPKNSLIIDNIQKKIDDNNNKQLSFFTDIKNNLEKQPNNRSSINNKHVLNNDDEIISKRNKTNISESDDETEEDEPVKKIIIPKNNIDIKKLLDTIDISPILFDRERMDLSNFEIELKDDKLREKLFTKLKNNCNNLGNKNIRMIYDEGYCFATIKKILEKPDVYIARIIDYSQGYVNKRIRIYKFCNKYPKFLKCSIKPCELITNISKIEEFLYKNPDEASKWQ